MSPQRNWFLLLLGGVVIPYLCEVIAQVLYRETLDLSLQEGPGGVLWLAAPFLAVSFALLLARRALPARRQNGLFLGALSALGGWYLFGYFGQRHYPSRFSQSRVCPRSASAWVSAGFSPGIAAHPRAPNPSLQRTRLRSPLNSISLGAATSAHS